MVHVLKVIGCRTTATGMLAGGQKSELLKLCGCGVTVDGGLDMKHVLFGPPVLRSPRSREKKATW